MPRCVPRWLYQPNQRLEGYTYLTLHEVSLEICLNKCFSEEDGRCLSVNYIITIHANGDCFMNDGSQKNVTLTASSNHYYYEHYCLGKSGSNILGIAKLDSFSLMINHVNAIKY